MLGQPGSPRADWRASSPWVGDEGPAPAPPLDEDLAGADVVVVGAGLTGLITANVLSTQGAEVVVLDRHDVGGVVSRGSTAKLSALQGTIYDDLRSRSGDAAAASYAAASVAGVEGVQSLIERAGIDCSLRPAPALTYATTRAGAERATAELQAASRAGLPVRWTETTELGGDVVGAVCLDRQAHLDPGALCAGLARALGPSGRVHADTTVTSIEERDDGCTVRTATGRRVGCDHVVVATHGPIDDPAQLAARCTPHRSYAIAARLGAPVTGMYLSVEEPVRSVRPAVIDGQPAVIVGGEGHLVGDGEPADPWGPLERFAREVLAAGPVTHRWSAHDLVPSDHVPFIGPLHRGSGRRWVATGFRKWGVSTAWVAADLISARMAGETRPWAGLFDTGRLRSSMTGDLARAAVRNARHVGRRVGRSTTASGRRTVCTHLGCELRANDLEGTWDCPCHGSRFDADGLTIAGPAIDDLPIRGRRRAPDR